MSEPWKCGVGAGGFNQQTPSYDTNFQLDEDSSWFHYCTKSESQNGTTKLKTWASHFQPVLFIQKRVGKFRTLGHTADPIAQHTTQ